MNRSVLVGSAMIMAIMFGGVQAAGGKMRLASDLITEGYLLCAKDGVKTVVVDAGGTKITIDCEKVPAYLETETSTSSEE